MYELFRSGTSGYIYWEVYKTGSIYADAQTHCKYFSRSWKLSKNDPKYDVYKKFIEVVTKTTYDSLQQYNQFLNDSFLDELNMLQIAKEVKQEKDYICGSDFVLLNLCFCSTDARIYVTWVRLQFSNNWNGHLFFVDLFAFITKCIRSVKCFVLSSRLTNVGELGERYG